MKGLAENSDRLAMCSIAGSNFMQKKNQILKSECSLLHRICFELCHTLPSHWEQSCFQMK